jgi:RecJ-like exonuclease
MKKSNHWLSIGALLAAATFASVGYAAEENSGFLGDYSGLTEAKDASGDTLLRYVNPKIKHGTYQKVMIDHTQFYPAPKPSEQVSESTLTEISNYVDQGLHAKLGSKLTIVTEPGPGVIRIRPAITSVAAQTPGLKPYQVIPIAFIVTSAKGRGKEAAIQIEVEMVDSLTGERVGASVRKGSGAKLASDKAPLRLSDVKPLLDKWIDSGAAFVTERLK